MHERQKLDESRHFLERMNTKHGDQSAFNHELSAFLAAARSVLQYLLKEAVSRPGGQQWYAQAMNSDPLLCYFKKKRNLSIHEEPVLPLRRFSTESAGFIRFGDDDDEMLIPYPHQTTIERYEVQDRPGEDVYALSQRYLELLEAIVQDGIARGLITGQFVCAPSGSRS